MPKPPDPPWKVKTRPCPFFSRGTCLFSDSCNFIHTVKSPVAPEIRITESRDSVLSVYGYPTATTPPNVTSPTLSDRQSPPHADVEVIAPKPRVWEQARRLSWTSIHSISSADSNLTYPTDLSPTASRVSTPPIGEDISLHQHDIHDSYDPSDLRYSRESQLTITNIDRAQRLLQLATESDEDPSPGSGRVALPLPSQPTPLTGSSEATTDASDPSAQVVAFKPTNGSTNSLGEPFRLNPIQPRRTRSSKDSNHATHVIHDEFEDSPLYLPRKESMLSTTSAVPSAVETTVSELSRRKHREQQLTLNEVLLNLQDPALRPRRINRLMQGLPPDTPLNAVSPGPQRHRPLPFQGDGNWKSEAFRKASHALRHSYTVSHGLQHLSTLISNRSAMISQSPPETRMFAIDEMLPATPKTPETAPPQRAEFEPFLPPRSIGIKDTTRFMMTDAVSPDGQTPAFKRPQRPARKRIGQATPGAASPLVVSAVIPSNVSPPTRQQSLQSVASYTLPLPVEVPIIRSPSPPRRTTKSSQGSKNSAQSRRTEPRTPPRAFRLGSLTGTPVHDSPGDFRLLPRTNFTPIEDDNALATSDALEEYAADVSGEIGDMSAFGNALEEIKMKRRSKSLSIASSRSRGSRRQKTSSRVLASAIAPEPEVAPSIVDVTDMDDMVSALAASEPESEDRMTHRRSRTISNDGSLREDARRSSILAEGDSPSIITPDSSSPKSHLRPLRLSILFDKAQKIMPLGPTTPGSSGSGQRTFRRPLTALLADAERPLELDSTPHASSSRYLSRSPSPTPRKHHKKPSATNTQGSSSYPLTSTPLRPSIHSSKSFSSSPNKTPTRNDPQPQIGHDLFSPPRLTPNSAPLPQSSRMSHNRSISSRTSSSSLGSITSTASAAAAKPPRLIFAIAKDDPQEVERLLASGEANANDRAGPEDLPALLFTMGNDQLKNKTQIVKTLLAYGADPSVLQAMSSSPPSSSPVDGPGPDMDDHSDSRRDSVATIRPINGTPPPEHAVRDSARQISLGLNPEIGYYLSRAPELPPKQLEALRNAGFDPLTRVPFSLVGQDLVLQELLRVLARHSLRGGATPVSIIFAGPSGHGKSLLSRSIGELLRIPAHTVNMTNLKTQDELLQSRSLSSMTGDVTLAKFLDVNEGKRCAVILEEIEKVADKSVPNTLLMPWELGKLNTTQRLYDTSQVIWISTSNAGEDAVFEFERNRGSRPCERNDYLDLATSIRRRLIESLGASLVSRITTVLPFLTFTDPEKLALAYQHLPPNNLSKSELDLLLQKVVHDYIPSEGVRSIQRAVQRHYEEELW